MNTFIRKKNVIYCLDHKQIISILPFSARTENKGLSWKAIQLDNFQKTRGACITRMLPIFAVVTVTKTGLTHWLTESYRATKPVKKSTYKFYWYNESNTAN